MSYTITLTPSPHTHKAPPRGTRIQKIVFVAPTFASAEISKAINMLFKQGTTNANDSNIKLKWYIY